MQAQTAMIENAFVHVPDTAPWLAQYLHELTSFPNEKSFYSIVLSDRAAELRTKLRHCIRRPTPKR